MEKDKRKYQSKMEWKKVKEIIHPKSIHKYTSVNISDSVWETKTSTQRNNINDKCYTCTLIQNIKE